MVADCSLPLDAIISAAAGLLGVVVGGAIALRQQREERRHRILRDQLEQFYSPMLGLRARILAKSEVRLKVSGAADAEWRRLVERAGGDVDAAIKRRPAAAAPGGVSPTDADRPLQEHHGLAPEHEVAAARERRGLPGPSNSHALSKSRVMNW